MPSSNRVILDKFFQTGNTGDFSEIYECFGGTCIFHSRSGDGPRDVEDFKRTLMGTREMFPDMHSTIDVALEDIDKIAVAFTSTGTHRTLKKQTVWRAVNIYRFSGGKIVEVWIGRDDLGAYQKLGILPPDREIIAKLSA